MFHFEFLEHPADIKVRVNGNQKADLFVGSAWAMMSFLYGDEVFHQAATHYEELVVRAPDCEALLVDWLSELLTLSDMRHSAFIHFKISVLENQFLRAELGSCPAVAEDDIKAVTWSELAINQTEEGWTTTVVFDI